MGTKDITTFDVTTIKPGMTLLAFDGTKIYRILVSDIVSENSNAGAGTSDSEPYTLLKATATELGGVLASPATSEDNAPVRITTEGYLRVKAYQKPSGGIPASDIADGVVEDLARTIKESEDEMNLVAGHEWGDGAWLALRSVGREDRGGTFEIFAFSQDGSEWKSLYGDFDGGLMWGDEQVAMLSDLAGITTAGSVSSGSDWSLVGEYTIDEDSTGMTYIKFNDGKLYKELYMIFDESGIAGTTYSNLRVGVIAKDGVERSQVANVTSSWNSNRKWKVMHIVSINGFGYKYEVSSEAQLYGYSSSAQVGRCNNITDGSGELVDYSRMTGIALYGNVYANTKVTIYGVEDTDAAASSAAAASEENWELAINGTTEEDLEQLIVDFGKTYREVKIRLKFIAEVTGERRLIVYNNDVESWAGAPKNLMFTGTKSLEDFIEVRANDEFIQFSFSCATTSNNTSEGLYGYDSNYRNRFNENTKENYGVNHLATYAWTVPAGTEILVYGRGIVDDGHGYQEL